MREAVERAEHKQEITFDHFFNNGLKWNDKADPADVKAVFEALRELRTLAFTQAQRDVLGALLNNLPYKTNTDVAKLTSRINIAMLGLDIAKRLDAQKEEIVNRVTELTGKDHSGYNTQLRRRALTRVAVQTGNDTDTLPLIFKHAQRLSIDLDRVIDFQAQNHMNPNSLKRAAKDALEGNKQWNYKSDQWRSTVQKRYMHTRADLERIFVTEAKVTQVKTTAKQLHNDGYKYVKVVSRHSTNVCKNCEGMDGTKVKITNIVYGMNVPPFHPRCMCNIIPAETPVKEALDDLGL
ncbi:minor capsid protein [Limosilactobacillus reuteri]|uniref:minor capsid protein n=1 Tax=Limosilactobacillus reuteri TaxID=1598 RepID=UPI001E63E332|nr:minor capsid protein [Limosilactobacillus reuteri]MCC4470025.1 minor capsid protein [Limosilactobacillus reuteri]